MKLLSKKDLDTFCNKHPNWKLNKQGVKLTAIYTFESHIEALTYIMRLSIHAQVQNHHPDITFTFAKAKVVLTTHDTGGITRKDTKLAKVADTLYQQ